MTSILSKKNSRSRSQTPQPSTTSVAAATTTTAARSSPPTAAAATTTTTYDEAAPTNQHQTRARLPNRRAHPGPDATRLAAERLREDFR